MAYEKKKFKNETVGYLEHWRLQKAFYESKGWDHPDYEKWGILLVGSVAGDSSRKIQVRQVKDKNGDFVKGKYWLEERVVEGSEPTTKKKETASDDWDDDLSFD